MSTSWVSVLSLTWNRVWNQRFIKIPPVLFTLWLNSLAFVTLSPLILKTLPSHTVSMPSLSPWVHLWAQVLSRHSLRVPLVLLVWTPSPLQNVTLDLIQLAEGGKTGITAIVTGLLFFVSIFFAPIFASIPPWATGGALVVVGSLMIRNVRDINWDYVGDAVPAFLTILFIPLSYKWVPWTYLKEFEMLTARHSIAYGVIVGVLSYVIINGFVWVVSRASNNATSQDNPLTPRKLAFTYEK